MKLPVFVIAIGTVAAAPESPSVVICGWYVAPNCFTQQTVTFTLPVGVPFALNQATPSCARSKRS